MTLAVHTPKVVKLMVVLPVYMSLGILATESTALMLMSALTVLAMPMHFAKIPVLAIHMIVIPVFKVVELCALTEMPNTKILLGHINVNVLMDTVVMVIIVSIIPTGAAKKVQRFYINARKGSWWCYRGQTKYWDKSVFRVGICA